MSIKQAMQAQRAEILAKRMAVGNVGDTFTGSECKAVIEYMKGLGNSIQIHDVSVDGFAGMLYHAGHDHASVSVKIGDLKWLLNNAESVNRELTYLLLNGID